MNELWKIRRIGDVCRVIPGFAFKSTDWCNKGIPVVKITNISSDNRVDILNTDCVPESLITPKTSKYLLRYGDILVAMTGATAGKVGRLLVDRQIFLNQRVAKIEPVEADRDYIWSLVSSQEYQKRFFGLADGAAQPNMSGSQIESVEIPIPPLPIQRRIASILSAYDDLIENNRKRIAILEEMARRLYREWFVHFRYPGHESVPLVDSHLARIPQGWEVKSLGEVCSRITDGSHSSPPSVDDGFPMASVKDMHDWGINLDSCRRISTSDYADLVRNDCRPLEDDVLIAKDGSYLKHIFVVGQTQDMVILSSIAILRPNGLLKPNLLSFILRDPITKARMTGFVSGVAIPRIVLKDFRKFPIVIPSMGLQVAWSQQADSMVEMCRNLIGQNAVLRRTRDLLLPRLMSGQLSVTAAEAAAP